MEAERLSGQPSKNLHVGRISIGAARRDRVATMRRELITFFKDESGATSIEYCVVASGVVLAIITAVAKLGTSVHGMFVAVTTAMK